MVEATTIAVDVALRLWRPAAQPFGWIGNCVQQSLAEADPQSTAAQRLLEHGRRLFDELKVGDGFLIHGGLHHHNILARERATWRSIRNPCWGSRNLTFPRSCGIRSVR
jgi:streptomycin 6-kinase